ncbi:MAG TPA: sigma-70 family RNA polymerase sigma factor [Planctomycetota bacterium]|nr:sigma-70 family RNA polymerase sigma factor [Planctomycetota bacterium]
MTHRDSTTQSTSRSLLARAQANDAEAWDRLVDLYAPSVLRWCSGHGLVQHDVADVFQEVFHAAARHLAAFRKERPQDTFRGWLRTITANKIRDHFRRQKRDAPGVGGSEPQAALAQAQAPPPPDHDEEEAVAAGVGSELLQRALDQVRGTLREKTWLAFRETVLAGRAAVDVAAELGMTPGAVRVAKCRVLQRLREELADLE